MHEELPLLIPLSIGVVIILLLLFNNYIGFIGDVGEFQRHQRILEKQKEFLASVNSNDELYSINSSFLVGDEVKVNVSLSPILGVKIVNLSNLEKNESWLAGISSDSSLSLPCLINKKWVCKVIFFV